MEGPLSDTGSNFHVSQVINQDGGWSWDLLASLLPTELLEHIRSIPLPLSNEVKDEIFWSPTPDGKFTVKFAFQIQQPPPEPDEARWRWVWKIPCLERIRMFVWQVCHDRLLTNFIRFQILFVFTGICLRPRTAQGV